MITLFRPLLEEKLYMKKVLITGSSGRIGSVLCAGLQGFDKITEFDLPGYNVGNFGHLTQAFKGHDTVIHLAWNMQLENSRSTSCHPDNFKATQKFYDAAILTDVRRVIVASTVHADTFKGDTLPNPSLRPFDLPVPANPYGAHKVFGEMLGRHHAHTSNLEVVCIRFGSVCRDGESPKADEECVWLSNRDCTSLVQACTDAPKISGGFTIINGVSNNEGIRRHSVENPFGWVPLDSWPAA